MRCRQWLSKGALGLGLLSMIASSAIAQTPEPAPTSEPIDSSESVETSEPLAAPESTDSSVATPSLLQTYTLERSFALQIPEDWVGSGTEAERTAILTNYALERAEGETPQATDIKTEVRFVSEHPDTFVQQELAKMIEQAYPVKRYTPIKVNDRTALRLWIAGLPDTDAYANQIVTFVGYASYGTAMIVTSYNDNSPETQTLIEQVHNSFELKF